jgi:hypothetical protein
MTSISTLFFFFFSSSPSSPPPLNFAATQLMNGDTGALPPAVARLGGAFTDGCAVDGVEDSVGATSSSSRASSQNPLLRAAARLWRYQGLR